MKNSHAENLSESFLNVDQKIITEALEIDDAKKLKQYIKQKPEEAKKPFYIKPVFKKATAIAACIAIVAITAFALANKTNNITPNNDTSSGNNLSSNDASSNNDISSNNASSNNDVSSNNNSGTSSGNEKVIYVTAEAPDNYNTTDLGSLYLNEKYISPALQEKMDLYKDYKEAQVVYRLIVEIPVTFEDENEAARLANADKEVQSLYEQKEAGYLEEQAVWAEYRAFCEANPGNEPEVIERRKEFIAIIEEKGKIADDLYSKWSNLRLEIKFKYYDQVGLERLEFLKPFSEKEPVATLYNKWAYYVDLTAEEINILAEKGGYTFKFASGDFLPSDIDL